MQKILAVVCGFIILGASGAAWHYWDMHGAIAFLGACAGLTLIGHGCGCVEVV